MIDKRILLIILVLIITPSFIISLIHPKCHDNSFCLFIGTFLYIIVIFLLFYLLLLQLEQNDLNRKHNSEEEKNENIVYLYENEDETNDIMIGTNICNDKEIAIIEMKI